METEKIDLTAEENYQEGMKYLSNISETTNKRKALEYFLKASNQGHDEADFQVGILYIFGEPDIMKNHKKAFGYIKKSAETGIVNAEYQLAECYMFGIGIDRDEKEALTYYEKASKQGFLMADDRLCDAYRYGFGVEKNFDKALEYNARTRGYGNYSSEVKFLAIVSEKNKLLNK